MRPIIGRYIPGDSILHRLDPRCKILCLILITTSVLLVQGLKEYVIPGTLILIGMICSGIRPTLYLKGIKSISFLLIFAVAVQYIYAGLEEAIFIGLRLVLILFAAEVLTFTTQPTSIAHALEDILKIFGVPKAKAQEFSMIMAIAIRFAPIMLEEADRIMKAQMSRGAPIDTGKIFDRVKALSSIAIPLMASTIRKAEELSIAMEARRYRPGTIRSRYRKMEWMEKETAAIFLAAITLILTALI